MLVDSKEVQVEDIEAEVVEVKEVKGKRSYKRHDHSHYPIVAVVTPKDKEYRKFDTFKFFTRINDNEFFTTEAGREAMKYINRTKMAQSMDLTASVFVPKVANAVVNYKTGRRAGFTTKTMPSFCIALRADIERDEKNIADKKAVLEEAEKIAEFFETNS